MKVKMIPSLQQVESGESGIHTIVRKYHQFAEDYGIQFVTGDDYDLLAVHAGTKSELPNNVPIVAHTHGLYFNGDYNMPEWSYKANGFVIDSVRASTVTTVPSPWVGKIFERDMRFSPEILPHGIDLDEWSPNQKRDDYIISYAKNRDGVDVCDSSSSTMLAMSNPQLRFLQTFAKDEADNLKVTGVMPHDEYMEAVKSARVFVSPVKETFGIAVIEAMAAGVPVLTVDHGHAPNLVKHGVGGYCYTPGDQEDMKRGLIYCLEHNDVLSRNARKLAEQYTWDSVMKKLVEIYELALDKFVTHGNVSIVVPVYNKKPEDFRRAVSSAVNQNGYDPEVIVVNDGSDPELSKQYKNITDELGARYIFQVNQGVALARNNGILRSSGDYVMCLDSDDEIHEDYLKNTVPVLEQDKRVGVAYTKLMVRKDGKMEESPWPNGFDYDKQIQGINQIHTAALFRREMFDRLGGYRRRFAPSGAGEEDAEFWLRAGAYGWGAKMIDKPLFIYSLGTGLVSGNKMHRATNYLEWHSFTRDGIPHPVASQASASLGSHPVFQRDEPKISVIIPIGPGHHDYVFDALDSVEAQTYHNWEIVAVWDYNPPDKYRSYIERAYPHVNWVQISDCGNAAKARNKGVENAKAPFLLFLDADDYLKPTAMAKMISAWNRHRAIIYSSYYGIAYIEDINNLASDIQVVDRRDDNLTLMKYRAAKYDHSKAVRQPENKPYIWNNITCLMPRSWHDEIGGFDESLPSWEDVEYWWRAAWFGKDFHHVEDHLMVYRFHTGTLRDRGFNMRKELLNKIREKKDGLRRRMQRQQTTDKDK